MGSCGTATFQKKNRNYIEPLVIRLADKGSKFFILDREDYVERVLVHLNTIKFTAIEDQVLAIEEVKTVISKWCEKYKDEEGMTERIVSAVQPDENCKPRNNYLLLKGHKPEQNFPGCASFTKTLSHLTEIELN